MLGNVTCNFHFVIGYTKYLSRFYIDFLYGKKGTLSFNILFPTRILSPTVKGLKLIL